MLSMRVAAVIPAFDAQATIATVVRDVLQEFRDLGDVFVVDDGSSDDTRTRAVEAGARLVLHRKNLGKGCALRSGLTASYEAGYQAAVTIDADGQHPAAEAKRLACIPQLDALVLGVRDLRQAGAPRPNRISNAISNGFLSAFSRKRLADTQCGLRRYPLPQALRLGAKDDGYAFESEIILLAVAQGIPLIELPVRVLYPEDRTTHFHSVKDPMRVVMRVVRTLVATRCVTRSAVDGHL